MIKDAILKGYLENFKSDNHLEMFDESKLFEYFVNYNIIFRDYDTPFDLEDVSTGGDGDLGIDGIAIIINGKLICSVEEFEYIMSCTSLYETTFILVQSKTSSSFDVNNVGTFLYGAKAFFDEDSKDRKNEKIMEFQNICSAIYKKVNPRNKPPILKLFYVTTGKWENPKDIVMRAEKDRLELEEKNMFSEVQLNFFGKKEICDLYIYNSRKIEKNIVMTNLIALPEILKTQKIKQAFLGCVSVKDYIFLITDDDGNLIRNLFCDNVRDFQGDNNKVNKKILSSVKDENEQLLLPLLNNGITIIVDKIGIVGSKYSLSNYQIVNGCQTSHILFEARESIKDDASVIIKIIETSDSEVTNKIIQATNSQSEVKEEAFESLKSFHKNLQDFYKSKEKYVKSPIYYERRSKEFSNCSEIKSYQIVTLSKQIKAYVSTELKQPYSTRRYFGILLSSNENTIFKDEKDFDKYYLSAYLVNTIEQTLNGSLSKEKISLRWKYILAYIIYNHACEEINGFNFETLLKKFDDNEFIKGRIVSIYEILQKIENENKFTDTDVTRSKDFITKLNEFITDSKRRDLVVDKKTTKKVVVLRKKM